LDNPKQIVARGFNSITQNYLKLVESMGPVVRDKYLRVLIDRLPAGARILELGCGAGVPMTQRLASHFKVVGVDISEEQLVLATRNVPEASFILADMTWLNFTDAAFDAVVAFYSITHVPRNEHFHLLTNIYRMLSPNGLLVATMGAGDLPDTVEPDWLGAPMFFSHFDGNTNVALISAVGFEIVSATDERDWDYDRPVCFRWIVACKPAST
jgi:ubiquinone/menaquinone biosynthesis C-methylase UbiE